MLWTDALCQTFVTTLPILSEKWRPIFRTKRMETQNVCDLDTKCMIGDKKVVDLHPCVLHVALNLLTKDQL